MCLCFKTKSKKYWRKKVGEEICFTHHTNVRVVAETWLAYDGEVWPLPSVSLRISKKPVRHLWLQKSRSYLVEKWNRKLGHRWEIWIGKLKNHIKRSQDIFYMGSEFYILIILQKKMLLYQNYGGPFSTVGFCGVYDDLWTLKIS